MPKAHGLMAFLWRSGTFYLHPQMDTGGYTEGRSGSLAISKRRGLRSSDTSLNGFDGFDDERERPIE
jgi:hypothetical protein